MLRPFALATAWLAFVLLTVHAPAAIADGTHPVGLRQVEYIEPKDHRTMWMAVFYPAVVDTAVAKPFPVALAANLHVYEGAEIAATGGRRPLIMLSHGRGSSAWEYVWLAETLAAHGYIVAALNHYQANRYDSEIAYLANKIWQRPIDVSLDITFLLNDPLVHEQAKRFSLRSIGMEFAQRPKFQTPQFSVGNN